MLSIMITVIKEVILIKPQMSRCWLALEKAD